MVNVRSCEIPRNVLQADTILVGCGVANLEQFSWPTHRRRDCWRKLHTKEDHDKFLESFRGQLFWNVRRSFNMDDPTAES